MSKPNKWTAEIVKLNEPVKDRFTGQKGAAVLLDINTDGSRTYLFQPRNLSPETHQPVTPFWTTEDRLEGAKMVPLPQRIPFEALGTIVTDSVTGFSGSLLGFAIHPTGCLHVQIQPAGTQKSGEKIAACDFCITRVTGKELTRLSKAEVEAEHRTRPSPTGNVPARKIG